MLETTGDTEGFAKASVTLKKREQALGKYCADEGLDYKSDRTAVVGYGRSTAAKASAAAKRKLAEQTRKRLDKSAESGIIELPDIQIGRSLGAKSKNYDILDPQTGEIFHLVEGSRLQNVEVFAGKGTRTSLHDGVAEGLTEQYGGQIGNWQHVKGHGIIDYYGDEIGAEIHWFQEDSVGRVKFKVKRWDE